MRCTNTSPFISSKFMQLLIKKSRFDQQASSFIKSPLKNIQIQNVKFSKYLSTPIILDAVVYEKTNFSAQNIPTNFNSLTSSDGLVEFNNVLFYEIQRSYLESCAFQCTSKISVICNEVSFVNLYLTSVTDGTGTCFRLEKTESCTFINCCFYKVVGFNKASQIGSMISAQNTAMNYSSFNPKNFEASTGPGFYIDKTIFVSKYSNYTSFNTGQVGILNFVNGYDSGSALFLNCAYYNNTYENLSVCVINGNTGILTQVYFQDSFFFYNTQIFNNRGNVFVSVTSCFVCKSPFGNPIRSSVSATIGDKAEHGIVSAIGVEEIIVSYINGMKASCKIYYRPTETKSIPFPTKSPLPYGDLEFETKESTVNAKLSIFVVTGIIMGIIIITSIVIIITQKNCPLFVGTREPIYLSDDSTDIDEEIYDEEVPILNAEQKRKIVRRMSDEFRDLNMVSQESEEKEEDPPIRRKHKRKRVKRRRRIEEESSRGSSRGSSKGSSKGSHRSHTHSERKRGSERGSEPNSTMVDGLDTAIPRRFSTESRLARIREIKSFDPNEFKKDPNYDARANHMRVVRSSTGSINPPSDI